MDQIKFRGGAQIGMIRTSWPFVTLTVSKDKVILNVPLAGKYSFEPKDIVSIEPISAFMTRGLKIRHRVKGYKENVEFLTFHDAQSVINQIRLIGFPVADSSS